MQDLDTLQGRANTAVSSVDDGMLSACFRERTAVMPRCEIKAMTIASVHFTSNGEFSPIRPR